MVTVIGLAVARHLLQNGFPPGVDTPTFLHLSWFTQQTLHGYGGAIDPYWYGGFKPFTTYPPLSYSLVGAIAAIPGMGFVFTYKVALLAAYIGTGLATYYLALQLDNSRGWSALAAVMTMLSYPLLVAVGLWGWFSSVFALPFAILSLALLERCYRRGHSWSAIAGGVAFGAAVLAHHMTAFAFALGLPGWFLFYFWREPDLRSRLYKSIALFVTAIAVTTLWWIIPWMQNMIEADFQRETAGLWSFPLLQYLQAITQRGLIGLYAYPNYMGIVFIVMAVGGTVHSMLYPSRTTSYAILLVLLVFFSLGEKANPLIRVRPLDGLDVARFQLYMMPVISVVALPFLCTVRSLMAGWLRHPRVLPWWPAIATGIVATLVMAPAIWDASAASRQLFQPYQVSPAAQEALDWLSQEGHEGKSLGVGFWHWDDFLLPYYLRRTVVDGWHDEGARNWRTVRALRIMMWSGKVDVPRAYQLLGELDGRYIIVQDYFAGESPDKFRVALGEYPQLFDKVADWGEVTIYERRSQG